MRNRGTDSTSQLRVVESRIRDLERELEEQKSELIDLLKRSRFESFSAQAVEITERMDDWIREAPANPYQDCLISALFLGACSGEWAARSRYRGELPGFGGFMLCLAGKRILIDPGNQTFSALLLESYHPSHLDLVIATHSHWDCIRDLDLILMAANPVLAGRDPRSARQTRLLADPSVLYGLRMDPAVVARSEDTQRITGLTADELRRRLSQFESVSPAAVDAYDLFVRLAGRFDVMEIGKAIKVSEKVTLHVRRSHHRVSWGQEFIPALDFAVKDGNARARCVYLSDTEYRPNLAEQYQAGLSELGPIDLLICNVKTLDLFSYPESDELRGYTQKHLGWKGVLQLTRDLLERKVLTEKSLVVLRAWGLETVTTLDEKDHALIATPDKLEAYQQQFQESTGLRCVIPGITWVSVDPSGAVSTSHRRPPFLARGDVRRFGSIYYKSEEMEKVVRQARALTDNPKAIVLIIGEPGTGKDVLARSIYQESRRPGVFADYNAKLLEGDLAKTQLFGQDEGVFTHGTPKAGWFEEARGGTLSLQELPEMDPEHQALFLQVLEDRTYRRVGSNKKIDLDAQIIATTNRNLNEALKTGRLRRDLYDRFDRVIYIPPLRQRLEDIPAILAGWRAEQGSEGRWRDLGEDTLRVLKEYKWPGNVRQLRKVLEAVAQSQDWSPLNVHREIEKSDHPAEDARVEAAADSDLDDIDQSILGAVNGAQGIGRRELQEKLPALSEDMVRYHLKKLVSSGHLSLVGGGRNSKYRKA
ncbi:MAG TPA: sigma 54-interacting transcriptional regulator [Bryobacteraceae bacterium]|nr:sigma 54-interacting transcriptional regulator [Bryobacteraceae bacterium]